MSARVIPFATRLRHRAVAQRRTERREPRLTVQTEGTALRITVQHDEPNDPSPERQNFRPHFRD